MIVLVLSSMMLLSACNPPFNWREIHANDTPFTVLMPAKADSFSQNVQLLDVNLSMTMTATEVGQLSFAVGSAKLADASQASKVLAAMQNGMIQNIHGQITKAAIVKGGVMTVQGRTNNGDVNMAARFITHGNWVYQLIIIGPEKKMTPEIIDTFMDSFVAN